MSAKGAVSNLAGIDPDDTPEWTDEMFEQDDDYEGGRRIRAGRPPTEAALGHEFVLLSETIVRRFRETGPGWQSKIGEPLKVWPADNAGRS